MASELDLIVELVTELVDAPVALIAVGTRERFLFKSTAALVADKHAARASRAFCRRVVESGAAYLVEDAGGIAYLGVPIRNHDEVVGSLCAIDRRPRPWAHADVTVLTDAAASAGALLAL